MQTHDVVNAAIESFPSPLSPSGDLLLRGHRFQGFSTGDEEVLGLTRLIEPHHDRLRSVTYRQVTGLVGKLPAAARSRGRLATWRDRRTVMKINVNEHGPVLVIRQIT